MIVKCPRCGKSTNFDASNPSRPFCGERCRTIDLGAWADEEYRVPEGEANSARVNANAENATLTEENPPFKHKLN